MKRQRHSPENWKQNSCMLSTWTSPWHTCTHCIFGQMTFYYQLNEILQWKKGEGSQAFDELFQWGIKFFSKRIIRNEHHIFGCRRVLTKHIYYISGSLCHIWFYREKLGCDTRYTRGRTRNFFLVNGASLRIIRWTQRYTILIMNMWQFQMWLIWMMSLHSQTLARPFPLSIYTWPWGCP